MKYSEENYFDPKADIADMGAELISQGKGKTLEHIIEFREMCERVMQEKPQIDLGIISQEFYQQIQQ